MAFRMCFLCDIFMFAIGFSRFLNERYCQKWGNILRCTRINRSPTIKPQYTANIKILYLRGARLANLASLNDQLNLWPDLILVDLREQLEYSNRSKRK